MTPIYIPIWCWCVLFCVWPWMVAPSTTYSTSVAFGKSLSLSSISLIVTHTHTHTHSSLLFLSSYSNWTIPIIIIIMGFLFSFPFLCFFSSFLFAGLALGFSFAELLNAEMRPQTIIIKISTEHRATSIRIRYYSTYSTSPEIKPNVVHPTRVDKCRSSQCARVFIVKREKKKRNKREGGRESKCFIYFMYTNDQRIHIKTFATNPSMFIHRVKKKTNHRKHPPQILILLFVEALYLRLRWTCAAVCDALLLTTKTISFYFYTFVLSAVICVFRSVSFRLNGCSQWLIPCVFIFLFFALKNKSSS